MRNCVNLLLFALALFSSKAYGQDTDITGLWKGTLYNDTTQQYYRYEIAISEERGKLSGYSHTWFILDDKQYYGVKKVKVRRVDGKVIVEDDGLIANNYPVTPAKGVRQLNVLTLSVKDSILELSGPFATNRTKQYSPLTGTVSLTRKNDYWQSALVPHLQELKELNKLSFVKLDLERQQQEDDALALERRRLETVKAIPVQNNTDNKSLSVTESPIKHLSPVAIATNKAPETDKLNPVKQQPEIIKDSAAAVAKIPASIKTPIIKNNAPAADVGTRKTELQQTVFFASDSLQLALYDNGEVDGDTVSVLLNGEIIMAKERLSTNAVRKTIFINPAVDRVELVMYAENLGSIAPNTGLLVVRDGKDIYEIRFSGDLQRNAAIVLSRKKN